MILQQTDTIIITKGWGNNSKDEKTYIRRDGGRPVIHSAELMKMIQNAKEEGCSFMKWENYEGTCVFIVNLMEKK